jgi:hypothetical protein
MFQHYFKDPQNGSNEATGAEEETKISLSRAWGIRHLIRLCSRVVHGVILLISLARGEVFASLTKFVLTYSLP